MEFSVDFLQLVIGVERVYERLSRQERDFGRELAHAPRFCLARHAAVAFEPDYVAAREAREQLRRQNVLFVALHEHDSA